MSCVWRPFDVEECGTSTTTQKKQDKNERLKIKVGEQERAIVLETYERNIDKGWDAVVQQIKVNIEKMPLSFRVMGYYLEGEPKTITKRVRRIVREALKEAASGTSTSNCVQTNPNAASGTSGAARSVIDRQTRYAKKRTPEERRQDRMAEFVKSSESEEGGEEAGPPAKKKTTLRDARMEAQTAHKSMCQETMASMQLINNVMKQMSRKIDEF